MIAWITISVLGMIPVLFLPLTQDFYDTTKWTVLVLSALIVSLVTGVTLFTKKPRIPAFTLGVVAFGALTLAALISLIVSSTNTIEALVTPVGLGTFAALTILCSVSIARRQRKILAYVLYGVTAALNLVAIYQFFGMGAVMFPTLTYLSDPLWTPTGATTTTLAVSAIALAALIPDTIRSVKKAGDHTATTLCILALFVIAVGSTLTFWQMAGRISTTHMPLSAAWAVAVGVLANGKTTLAGAGAENFVSAYTQFKPASLLATPIWNLRFAVSTSLPFHLVSVYGVIGLLALFFLIYAILKALHGPYTAACITVLATIFIVPPTLTLLIVIALIFILSQPEIPNNPTRISSLLLYPAGIILCVAALFGALMLARFYIAEYHYFTAISKAKNNEGTATYNELVAAITANPQVSRYHVTMSQVSLSIAGSTGATLAGQLVQQGIAEGKAAVTLDPQNVVVWENLGSIYASIMDAAPGSDTWAAASYRKALSLDPTNPVLLTNLGGVLVHEKKYTDALPMFNEAIALKPDNANAYYNAAHVYKLTGDTANAKSTLTTALRLVPVGSSDYTRVKTELDSL